VPSRARILTAAVAAFSSVGFAGASTRQIARDAHVTHQLVAHYFPTKRLLWEAAVNAVFEPAGAAIRARLDGLEGVDARTVAKLVMKESVVTAAKHPELNRILLQEAKVGGELMRWLVDNHIVAFRDLFVALLAPLGVREGDPALARIFYTLIGAGATIFSAAQECQLLFDLDPFDPGFVNDHAEAVATMVLASIEQ
jgi:AcrR family transcriptional regulator